MKAHYVEGRGRAHFLPANMVADGMRHFYARQHLGKAVVVCDDPAEMVAVAGRQWLKLARTLQQQRGAATDAVEILKYTYTITQMQHVQLVAALPQDRPEARLYFVRPDEVGLLPADGLTAYLTTKLAPEQLKRLVAEMPASALVVDYCGQVEVGQFGLRPKLELEEGVAASWCAIELFLARQQLDAHRLMTSAGPVRTSLMDDAVDTLLERPTEFLALASMFQHTLDLARPLKQISKAQRAQYERLMELAHRVQALSPGGFSAQFLKTYADDAFFLSDVLQPNETVAEAVRRHEQAGRLNVVRALMRMSERRTAAWGPAAAGWAGGPAERAAGSAAAGADSAVGAAATRAARGLTAPANWLIAA